MTTTLNGKATTEKTIFSRTTTVSIDIEANKSIIWKLLTKASDYARWNSTIISIDGNIILGATISLKSQMAPTRIFKLKIKEYIVDEKLSWGDAMGTRVFTLTSPKNGITNFNMTEKIGGPMFPLFAKHIPSFDHPFEQFASDLKKEAEKIQNINN